MLNIEYKFFIKNYGNIKKFSARILLKEFSNKLETESKKEHRTSYCENYNRGWTERNAGHSLLFCVVFSFTR